MSEMVKKADDTDFMSQAIENMPGGVFIYRADESEEILYVNRHALEIFECETMEQLQELTGGEFRGMIYRDDLDVTENTILDQIRSGNDHFDHVIYRIVTRTGRIRTIEDYGHLVEDPKEGPLYYVFIQDADIKYLSHDIDPLTRLPGMRRFLEYSARMIRMNMDHLHAPQPVFLFFNILNFKFFNVRYGTKQGDRLLVDYANVLRDIFKGNYVARFSDDHFVVFLDDTNLLEKLTECNERLNAIHPESRLASKVGIFQVQDLTMDLVSACDYARIAANSIRNRPDVFFAYYTEALRERMNLQEYVKDHIDEACEKGYLRVYYQPVIRTVTGDLCGMEALARWIDPDMGFLSPGDFISALEESRQIQKLDTYIVTEICKNYAKKTAEGQPVVPVSFNLSRMDFMLCDIFSIVEDAVREYGVPRDMIHVEITESLFVQETEKISREIERFHEAGYQVWMDDFGSGYSSLNVLKDYEFDELKIDMVFLSNFNQKSKEIIASIVRMAKKVGIQTLAEGVETKEQFEFLKNIGCEKVQGYYFGKPLPYDESLKVCVDAGLMVENRTWRTYYDRVGSVDFGSDLPIAIMESGRNWTRFLFANEAYKKVLEELEIFDVQELADMMEDEESIVGRVFRSYRDRLISTGAEEVLTYPLRGQYIRVTGQRMAQCNDRSMIRMSLDNISKNVYQQQQTKLDGLLRNIYYMYDDICLVNVTGDYCEGVMADDGFYLQNRSYDLKKRRELFAQTYVYPQDRIRYREFLEPSTLSKRFGKVKGSPLYGAFRMKQPNGDYRWTVNTLIKASTEKEERYLHCLQKAHFLKDETVIECGTKANEATVLSHQELWDSIVNHSPLCYFWKDKERRFVGVSQSFLDYYGLEDESDVIGKTDEQMRWHIDDEPYHRDEMDVLEKGKEVIDSPGKCSVKGVVHDIFATKIPVYRDGGIVGLVGYFVDANRRMTREGINQQASVIDSVTGVASIRTIIEHVVGYMQDYQINEKDFAFLLVEIPEYERIVRTYGQTVGDCLLQKVANVLTKNISLTGSVGRIYGATFAVVYRYEHREDVSEICYGIGEDIRGIHEVDGRPCTLFTKIGTVFGDEVKDLNEMSRLANDRKRMY